MKLDKRRKYYLILDCETASLPCAENFYGKSKKNIAIAKPLIYDLGWQIIDKKGNVYKKENFLISEIFSVPSIFNTAYYASKRPIYLERLKNKEITLTDWKTATDVLLNDLNIVDAVGAYNSMFDFKKAIPFTDIYINKLYSSDFYNWLDFQIKLCDVIAKGENIKYNENFNPDIFHFRKKDYKLFDLWGLSAEYLLNNDDYRNTCINNNWITQSEKYFSTTAETTYRYIKKDTEFTESHTALDDAIIESEIFWEILKKTKGKVEIGIEYFPFRILGRADIYIKR